MAAVQAEPGLVAAKVRPEQDCYLVVEEAVLQVTP
jgi:hypothetical protein